MDYPGYYTDFWARFRALNPGLPTGSGWMRNRGDLGASYDGARSTRWPNVYCHVGFVDRGSRRRLMVEWYESDRGLPEWTEFLQRVAAVKLPFTPVVENDPGKKFERRRAYLTSSLTLNEMEAERDDLLRIASDAYRLLVVHLQGAPG